MHSVKYYKSGILNTCAAKKLSIVQSTNGLSAIKTDNPSKLPS